MRQQNLLFEILWVQNYSEIIKIKCKFFGIQIKKATRFVWFVCQEQLKHRITTFFQPYSCCIQHSI